VLPLPHSRAFSAERVRANRNDFAKSAKKLFNDDEDSGEEMNMFGVEDSKGLRTDPRSMVCELCMLAVLSSCRRFLQESMPQRWWHVDGRIKEALWKLYSKDPATWTLQRLSDEFGLHEARVDAILRLKRIEKVL
jgi:hypothetical protein